MSAEPTDEVFIKTNTAYFLTDNKYNDNCLRRTSDARPYNNSAFLNCAAVGAAIGRPLLGARPQCEWQYLTELVR